MPADRVNYADLSDFMIFVFPDDSFATESPDDIFERLAVFKLI